MQHQRILKTLRNCSESSNLSKIGKLSTFTKKSLRMIKKWQIKGVYAEYHITRFMHPIKISALFSQTMRINPITFFIQYLTHRKDSHYCRNKKKNKKIRAEVAAGGYII